MSATEPMAINAQQAAIAAGNAVLRGEGDGTYSEAADAIRLLIAAFTRPKAEPPNPHSVVLHDLDDFGFMPVEVLRGQCVWLWQGSAQLTFSPEVASQLAAVLAPLSPGVTDNARLLLGYMAGLLLRPIAGEASMYSIETVDAAAGFQVVKHEVTGNTYRIAVEQLSGPELESSP